MCKLNTNLWKHIYIFLTYTLSTHTRCNCIIIMGWLLGQQLISFCTSHFKCTNILIYYLPQKSTAVIELNLKTIILLWSDFSFSITQSAVQTFADMVWLFLQRVFFLIIRRLLMCTVEQTTSLLHSNQWCSLLCSAQPWNKKYSLYFHIHVTLNYTNIN